MEWDEITPTKGKKNLMINCIPSKKFFLTAALLKF
jgi:hypothetical protein